MNRPKQTRKMNYFASVTGEKTKIPNRSSANSHKRYRQPSDYYNQEVNDLRFLNSPARRASEALALAS